MEKFSEKKINGQCKHSRPNTIPENFSHHAKDVGWDSGDFWIFELYSLVHDPYPPGMKPCPRSHMLYCRPFVDRVIWQLVICACFHVTKECLRIWASKLIVLQHLVNINLRCALLHRSLFTSTTHLIHIGSENNTDTYKNPMIRKLYSCSDRLLIQVIADQHERSVHESRWRPWTQAFFSRPQCFFSTNP